MGITRTQLRRRQHLSLSRTATTTHTMAEQVTSPGSEQQASPKTTMVQRYATEADVLALMTADKFKKFCKKKCGEPAPASIARRARTQVFTTYADESAYLYIPLRTHDTHDHHSHHAGAAASHSNDSPKYRRSWRERKSGRCGARSAVDYCARPTGTSTPARWRTRSWRGGDAWMSTRCGTG